MNAITQTQLFISERCTVAVTSLKKEDMVNKFKQTCDKTDVCKTKMEFPKEQHLPYTHTWPEARVTTAEADAGVYYE